MKKIYQKIMHMENEDDKNNEQSQNDKINKADVR